jgi:LPS-assembly lipoprotein
VSHIPSGRCSRLVALLRLGAALCCALVLSGCGWRLQGNEKLSGVMAVTYVDTDDHYTDFNRALRDSLRASGVRLTTTRQDATAIVKIIKDQSGQRVLSISGCDRGQETTCNTPEEYEVFYTIEYSVDGLSQQGGGASAELIAPQKLELTRDFSYDVTAVLAKQREQAVLREALARDLAGLVVRRLASL